MTYIEYKRHGKLQRFPVRSFSLNVLYYTNLFVTDLKYFGKLLKNCRVDMNITDSLWYTPGPGFCYHMDNKVSNVMSMGSLEFMNKCDI